MSLFPGIGLLDRAFEEEGFCVVRGPDVLWGGDIHNFHTPAGVFDGVIGGPPCQAFSQFRHLNPRAGYKHGNLIPEYERQRLAAETEALRAQNEQARELYAAMLAELNALRAEIERQRAEINQYQGDLAMTETVEHWINDWTDRERDAFLRGMKANEQNEDIIEALASTNALRAEIKRLRAALDQHHPLLAESLLCEICTEALASDKAS